MFAFTLKGLGEISGKTSNVQFDTLGSSPSLPTYGEVV